MYLAVIMTMFCFWGVATNVNAQTYDGSCGETSTWLYDSETATLTIEGTGSVTEIEGYSIHKELVENVIISEGITKLESSNCFENFKDLTSVNLPDSLTYIGDYSFAGCDSLKAITIPKSVTYGHLAFSGSGLSSVTFAEGMTEIPEVICKGCSYLENITIPESVTVIASSAFEDCIALTSITLLESIKFIESDVFEGSGLQLIYGFADSYAETYAEEKGIKFSAIKQSVPKKGSTHKLTKSNLKVKITNASTNGKGTVSVVGMIKKSSSITIPKTVKIQGYTYKVTEIGKKAFYNQSKLKKVTIKSTTIKKIGTKAFYKIHKKATISVPKSKKSKYKKMIQKSKIAKTVKIK